MSDAQPSQPTRPESIQTEQVNLNLSELSPEQVDSLRARLRELASGLGESLGELPGTLAEPTHSSHKDSDGWI